MNQLGLDFEARTLARRTDAQTSKAAAERVAEFGSGHEARILGAMTGPMTYREIAAACGMEPVAVARRLKGMESKRLIARVMDRDGRVVERAGMALWFKQ